LSISHIPASEASSAGLPAHRAVKDVADLATSLHLRIE